MNDALAVSLIQSIGNLRSVGQQMRERQWTFLESVCQSFAFNAFHYEKLDAVLRSYVVQRANVGVIQTGDRLGLALKACPQNWILGEIRRKNFDRNRAIQTGVSSAVDFTHAARTERREDLVRPEFSASVQCH